MKRILTAVILFWGVAAFGQSATGKSQVGPVKAAVPRSKPVEKPPMQPAAQGAPGQVNPYTPFLTANIVFKDSSGNNVLEAGESAEVFVDLKNVGGRTARDCRVELVPSSENSNISVMAPPAILQIPAGCNTLTRVLLSASHYISTGDVQFTLKVLEKNGFDLGPEKVLVIPALAFQPPKVELADYGVQDPKRTGKIEKREVVLVTLRLQNKGAATSHGTTAQITLGPNVLPIQVDSTYNLGDLKQGDYRDISATIITNDRATEVSMDVSVTDKNRDFEYTKKLELPFDTPQKKVQEVVIADDNAAGPQIPNVAGLKLDIADNIPAADTVNPYAVAVIIGDRDYNSAPEVDYAVNDGTIMKRYVETAMGYMPGNIIYMEDATQGDLIRVFGNETNYKGQLYDYVRKGLSEVFVYYSGHGALNPGSKEGYLVPVDCDPNHVALNGYSLKTLYSNLDKIDREKELKHVTVVLDACFSGAAVNGTLLANVSPVYITVDKDVMVSPNATIITSATGDQVSGWYNDKQQSLFTYFFLKGLQGGADYQRSDTITARELYEFTADEVNGVPYWSRRLNGRTQTPTFYGSDWIIHEGKR